MTTELKTTRRGHKITVSRDPRGKWLAQLRQSNDEVVAEFKSFSSMSLYVQLCHWAADRKDQRTERFVRTLESGGEPPLKDI